MGRQAIPYDQDLAWDYSKQLFQEDDDVWAFDRLGEHLEVKVPAAQSRNQRKILPVEVMEKDWCLALRSPCAAAMRLLGQSAFVNKDDGAAFLLGFF